MMLYRYIRKIVYLYRLLSRHAVTHRHFRTYVKKSICADYSVDTPQTDENKWFTLKYLVLAIIQSSRLTNLLPLTCGESD
jgi:hypothetical protein